MFINGAEEEDTPSAEEMLGLMGVVGREERNEEREEGRCSWRRGVVGREEGGRRGTLLEDIGGSWLVC